jgi:hypothetical protein
MCLGYNVTYVPCCTASTTLLDELGLLSHRPLLTVVNVAEDLLMAQPSEHILGARWRR